MWWSITLTPTHTPAATSAYTPYLMTGTGRENTRSPALYCGPESNVTAQVIHTIHTHAHSAFIYLTQYAHRNPGHHGEWTALPKRHQKKYFRTIHNPNTKSHCPIWQREEGGRFYFTHTPLVFKCSCFPSIVAFMMNTSFLNHCVIVFIS